MPSLAEIRDLFPHTAETVYLNHAAVSPLSRPVCEAMAAYTEERHRTHIENFFAVEPLVLDGRANLARMIGTSVDRVEFAPNTSYALNVLAQGFPWKPGDRIAVPACEFPANVYPFLHLESQGVVVDFIPHANGVVSLDAIEAALTPRTKLLSISWVQFLSGYRADLAAIGQLCKTLGVWFCVDAIQGLGALPIDVEACQIDFLACGGHKWLMAPMGIGFFYLTQALQDRITPMAGWLGGPVDWDDFFNYEVRFHDDATRFRLGTMNHLGIIGLRAATRLYLDATSAWCAEQVLARSQQLAEGLDQMGLTRYGSSEPDHASGIVTVHHDRPDAVYAHLQAQGIHIATRNRLLRFAPTYYNSPDEIDHTLDVLAAFDRSQVAARSPHNA